MAKQKNRPDENIGDFNASTRKLESIIDGLEAEDAGLEQSLRSFEEGIKLVRALQTTLRQAEQHVSKLQEIDGEFIMSEEPERGGK